MAKTYDIKLRTLNYAVSIIRLVSNLPKTSAGYAIADQIIKSGTSIGANIAEAQDAISKKEFIKTINISLKECRETLYWLVLIAKSGLIASNKLQEIINEGKELRAILSAIIKNARSRRA